MTSLKPGSRIIVATRIISHQQFEPIYQGIDLLNSILTRQEKGTVPKIIRNKK